MVAGDARAAMQGVASGIASSGRAPCMLLLQVRSLGQPSHPPGRGPEEGRRAPPVAAAGLLHPKPVVGAAGGEAAAGGGAGGGGSRRDRRRWRRRQRRGGWQSLGVPGKSCRQRGRRPGADPPSAPAGHPRRRQLPEAPTPGRQQDPFPGVRPWRRGHPGDSLHPLPGAEVRPHDGLVHRPADPRHVAEAGGQLQGALERRHGSCQPGASSGGGLQQPARGGRRQRGAASVICGRGRAARGQAGAGDDGARRRGV
mmetsp:Transcript_591/g.1336  ORF Transcript_591/g.1336 Transcript_591/m.1336 type:complete len:255 (+) Transcript_591:720-1484(+)